VDDCIYVFIFKKEKKTKKMDLPIIFESDLYVLLPEVFLVLMICILLVFGAVNVTNPWEGKVSKDLSSSINYLTGLTLFIGGFLSLNGT